MKKLLLIPLLAAIFLISSDIASASSPAEHIKWLNPDGELSADDNPLVSRVRQVFDRVLAAADKRDNCPPKLVIMREAGGPWCMCLKDGTVILTQKGMDICYQDVNETEGDARAAFILGHELAHLADGDFGDWIAFETVRKYGSDQRAVQELRRLFAEEEEGVDTDHARRNRKKKELRADGTGLLYAAMAGYDPGVIVNTQGKNFLAEWVEQITGKAAYTDERHPDPGHRAAFLLSYMKSVSRDLDIFHFGVRLYQLGKYSDALDFLEKFEKKFPCREVMNNIGLIHYQMAVNTLAEYDRDRAYRYKLAAILDTKTRAGKLVRGRSESKNAFKNGIRKAIRYFRRACEKDPFYVPGRVNLSSAYMMAGKYDKAIPCLGEGLNIAGDPGILNNHAIAMYLFQSSVGVDYFEQTVRGLRDVIKKYPAYPDTLYNLGRMLWEHGKSPEFRKSWERYLDVESAGAYAEKAGKALGIKKEKPGLFSQVFSEPPFVKPNDFYKKAKKLLGDFTMFPVESGNTSGRYFLGKDTRVLVLEDVVKLVESPVRQEMTLSELKQYGEPSRVLDSFFGTKTFVYGRFAVDVKDGRLTRVVHF
ncbi:hypothetical protein QUF80_09975 [Desulfococcaceae bacterium HSG8]|nr:hypothetical protein [Desulfococcaceae bacterium HSG8]